MAVLKAGSRPPWVGLGAAVWVQISAGNAYNFPLYSSSLKSVMGFSQQQVTILGVANDIGENMGIIPGIACNKFPPWVILSVGACACFLGYGVLWLAVSQTLTNLPYWLVDLISRGLCSCDFELGLAANGVLVIFSSDYDSYQWIIAYLHILGDYTSFLCILAFFWTQ